MLYVIDIDFCRWLYAWVLENIIENLNSSNLNCCNPFNLSMNFWILIWFPFIHSIWWLSYVSVSNTKQNTTFFTTHHSPQFRTNSNQFIRFLVLLLGAPISLAPRFVTQIDDFILCLCYGCMMYIYWILQLCNLQMSIVVQLTKQ